MRYVSKHKYLLTECILEDDNVKIDYGLSEAALKELEEQLKKVKVYFFKSIIFHQETKR